MHSFYNFALISGYIENDPTIGLEVPENEEHTVSIMTQEEIKLLLDCPQTVDFKGYRDKGDARRRLCEVSDIKDCMAGVFHMGHPCSIGVGE